MSDNFEIKSIQGNPYLGYVEAIFMSGSGDMWFFLRRYIRYRGGYPHCIASWSLSGVTFEELPNAPHFENEEQFFAGVFALNREKILSSFRGREWFSSPGFRTRLEA